MFEKLREKWFIFYTRQSITKEIKKYPNIDDYVDAGDVTILNTIQDDILKDQLELLHDRMWRLFSLFALNQEDTLQKQFPRKIIECEFKLLYRSIHALEARAKAKDYIEWTQEELNQQEQPDPKGSL